MRTQEINISILVEIPDAAPDAPEVNHYYQSDSRGMILVKDMHPYHMFNALRKAMKDFGAEVILKDGGCFKEMFYRLSQVDPESL